MPFFDKLGFSGRYYRNLLSRGYLSTTPHTPLVHRIAIGSIKYLPFIAGSCAPLIFVVTIYASYAWHHNRMDEARKATAAKEPECKEIEPARELKPREEVEYVRDLERKRMEFARELKSGKILSARESELKKLEFTSEQDREMVKATIKRQRNWLE